MDTGGNSRSRSPRHPQAGHRQDSAGPENAQRLTPAVLTAGLGKLRNRFADRGGLHFVNQKQIGAKVLFVEAKGDGKPLVGPMIDDIGLVQANPRSGYRLEDLNLAERWVASQRPRIAGMDIVILKRADSTA